MINYILFDMDNCLYPASSGLCAEMDKRISRFVADLLSLPLSEAAVLRKENVQTYGTTMKWLTDCKGFTDIDEYNKVIHPPDVENFLKPTENLNRMLENLPCPASVLSNAPKLHADRVLGYLGIEKYFENIFHLGFSGTAGKPFPETYQRALDRCKAEASTTLFIDDVPGYLTAFRELGGQVLLVDEKRHHRDKNLPSVSSILDLPDHLEKILTGEEDREAVGV